MNMLLNEIPLFLYFFIFIYIVKKYPYFFILFFYLIMQQIKNILSNYYLNINAPTFMREVDKYSTNDASLAILIVIYLLAFVAMIYIYNTLFKNKISKLKEQFIYKSNSKFFASFFIYITLLIIIVLIIHILLANTPLFNTHINKNNYWTDYALIPQIKILSSQLSFLLFILGYFYAKQIFFGNFFAKKIIYNIILLLSIFYYILMKQKFGGPLLMLFSFFLPYLLIGLLYKKINLSKLIKIVFLFLIIISATVYGYFYMRFGLDAGKMILERIFSLQSEIWEVTYHYFTSNELPFNKNEFFREISILLGFEDGFTGMKYVMSKVMDSDYFNFFIDIKINLSSAFPSYLFYIFEDPFLEFPFILFVSFFLYSIYIYLGFKVLEKLLQNKIIISGLYLKLMYSMEAIIGQVYLRYVFNLKIILFILLILILESNFNYIKKKIYNRDREGEK